MNEFRQSIAKEAPEPFLQANSVPYDANIKLFLRKVMLVWSKISLPIKSDKDQEAAVEHLKHSKETNYNDYRNYTYSKLAAQGHHRLKKVVTEHPCGEDMSRFVIRVEGLNEELPVESISLHSMDQTEIDSSPLETEKEQDVDQNGYCAAVQIPRVFRVFQGQYNYNSAIQAYKDSRWAFVLPPITIQRSSVGW